jgi:hypothetical protein
MQTTSTPATPERYWPRSPTAGTTALVAQQLGRNHIGIDLNADYVAMAAERLLNDCRNAF